MAQDNSAAAAIPIGMLAVVAIVYENYDKIRTALSNFFTPIFQFLGQLLFYGALVAGVSLIVFLIIQEVVCMFNRRKERIEAERQEVKSGIETAQADADYALTLCGRLGSQVTALTKLTDDLKDQIRKHQEEGSAIKAEPPAMEGN